MGGWMTYQRVRDRNGLLPRKPLDDPDPYWREYPSRLAELARPSWPLLVGDLDRMERDYLDPVYPAPPFAQAPEGSDPAAEVTQETGIEIETVRAVLRYVFREQR
jgi:hypothetical protein